MFYWVSANLLIFTLVIDSLPWTYIVNVVWLMANHLAKDLLCILNHCKEPVLMLCDLPNLLFIFVFAALVKPGFDLSMFTFALVWKVTMDDWNIEADNEMNLLFVLSMSLLCHIHKLCNHQGHETCMFSNWNTSNNFWCWWWQRWSVWFFFDTASFLLFGAVGGTVGMGERGEIKEKVAIDTATINGYGDGKEHMEELRRVQGPLCMTNEWCHGPDEWCHVPDREMSKQKAKNWVFAPGK